MKTFLSGSLRCLFVAVLVLWGVSTTSLEAKVAFDHEYRAWTKVVVKHVKGDRFDYHGLAGDQAAVSNAPGASDFSQALAELNGLKLDEYNSFTREQQMAFLINTYNILTVKLILDQKPSKSIKEIGGLFRKPWSIEFFSLLGGSLRSLDPIEHEWLRPRFKDYRIHAAVNCASVSCPPLRAEAFVATKLDQQLDEQMVLWLKDPTRNQIDQKRKVVMISKIFDWYESDFEDWSSGLRNVLSKHGGDDWKAAMSQKFKIRHLDYDWNLNEVRP